MWSLIEAGQPTGRALTDEGLAAAYAQPEGPWLRANFVSTIDGAAAGSDGRSGSINNAADRQVFQLLRRQCDAIVVGAGTARAEGYRPTDRLLVVVTRTGQLPDSLRDAPAGSVRTVTPDPEGRWVEDLRSEGYAHLLCEGGPQLLGSLLAGGLVDELCLTTTPHIVGGTALRAVTGELMPRTARLHTLLSDEDTLFARWWLRESDA